MRISDWSSDVCSSDLRLGDMAEPGLADVFHALDENAGKIVARHREEGVEMVGGILRLGVVDRQPEEPGQPGNQPAAGIGHFRMAQRPEQAVAAEIVAGTPTHLGKSGRASWWEKG